MSSSGFFSRTTAFWRGVSTVRVSTVIDRSPAAVWAELRDISAHVEWMHDAVAIRFLSEGTEGVGTTFECDTKVGPFALTDVMEITSWQEPSLLGVRHVGLVTGIGAFISSPRPPRSTELCWEERLVFPWWMGGPVGVLLAKPVLARIWRQNLRRLRKRVELFSEEGPSG